MVFENPVVDTAALVRTFDPFRRREAAYAELTRSAILSGGIRVGEASEHPVLLHCSLNKDAIVARRRGQTTLVADLRRQAQRIETEFLGPWLNSLPPAEAPELVIGDAEGSEGGWIDSILFAEAPGGRELVEPIVEAAQAVSEVRARFADADLLPQTVAGVVWSIDETFSEIRSDHLGESVPILTDEILDLGLKLGDPVVVTCERVDRGAVLTTVERALQTFVATNRLTGRANPPHIEQLLDAAPLPERHEWTRPLRHIA